MGKKTKGIGIAGHPQSLLASPSKESVHREMQYQARADAQTLSEAEQIRRDSGRMKAVKHHHKQLTKAIQGRRG